ncbi:MAG: response regulator [Candidatus Eremiobacterota bacterium]
MGVKLDAELSLVQACLEAAREAQAVLDEEGDILCSNRAWREFLPAEGGLLQHLPPEHRDPLARVLAGHRPCLSLPGRLPDRDLTLTVAALEHLSPRRFLAIWCPPQVAPELTNVPAFVLTLDRQGTILYCNTVAPGYRMEQVLGSSVYDWVLAEHRQVMEDLLPRVFEDRATVDYEVKGLGPNGSVAWYTGSIGPLVRDGAVELCNLVAVNSTSTRQARDRLSLFEHIFRHAHDAIGVIDLQGGYILQNAAHAALLEYSDEELPGLSPAVHLGEEAFARIAAELARSGRVRTEVVSRSKSGKIHLLELSAFTVYDSGGEPACYVGIKRNITQRKAIEEELARARDAALESARLKTEFLRNMSHEIRTPMNAVIGMTELLLETGLDAEQRRLAQTVHQSAESLLTILDDILDFSKVEAGLLKFDRVEFDPRHTLDRVLEMFAERAGARGLLLSGRVETGVPCRVVGDPGRVRQVLTNLVGNAVKFTHQGSVRVGVEALAPDLLRFSVRDTGIGIAPEDQPHLFSPFFQADASTRRQYGGTGLGLAISLQLVRLMGGEMGVDSRPGQGSTLWFTARLEPSQGSQRPPEVARQARVLVVEDNPVQRDILVSHLDRWGIQHQSADAYEQAVQAVSARDEPFELIMLDLTLPGSESDEAGLAQACDLSRLAQSRVVLLSPPGRCPSPDALTRAGVWGCLPKPVDPDQLRECLVALQEERPNHFAGALSPEEGPATLRDDLRVLVVEDNALNRLVIERQLSRLGVHVALTSDGQEALQEVSQAAYDIVLMDCQMPRMDGYDATRALRRELGGACPIIIAMTAHALEGERERCLEAGMDDYLAKPLRTGTLRAALERWQHVRRGSEPPPRSGSATD